MVTVDLKKQKKLEKLPFTQVQKDIQDNFLKYLGVDIDCDKLEKVSLDQYLLPSYKINLVVPEKGPIGYHIEEIPSPPEAKN